MARRLTRKEIERDIEKYLYKRAKEENALCFKFVAPGFSGVPDRILIKNGKVLFIELKAPNKKPRDLQVYVHELLQSHGATVLVIDNCDDIDLLFKGFTTKNKTRKENKNGN